MVFRELKRLFRSPLPYACIVIYTGILLLGILSDLNSPASYGWFQFFFLSENFGIAVFMRSLVFPMAAAYGCCVERKGHYDWLTMMRSGRIRYCVSQMTATIIASSLLYMASVLLFVAVGSLKTPSIWTKSVYQTLADEYPGGLWLQMAKDYGYWSSFLLYALLYSLHIGIFSGIAVCASVFCTNQYIVCTIPFLLERIGNYWGGAAASINYTPFGAELNADGGAARCIAWNLAAYAAVTVVYYLALKWRQVHG